MAASRLSPAVRVALRAEIDRALERRLLAGSKSTPIASLA